MKLEQQELSQLKQFQNQIDQFVIELGDINYQKFQLELREKQVKDNIQKVQQNSTDLSNKLFQKYGKIDINLETGEYTVIK